MGATVAATFIVTPHQVHTHNITVTVQQGQTVWSIAEEVNRDQARDTRNIVDEIMQLNHLGDATIQPGQVLEIPTDK